jgi:RHS repeat-associated protein
MLEGISGNADTEPITERSDGKVTLRKGDLTHRESKSKETVSALQDPHYMRMSPLSMGKSTLSTESSSSCTVIYSWDAENRLIKITYPGEDNFSDFVYDPDGMLVKIIETTSGSVTSTKQFVVCNRNKCEERDGSGSLVKKFFKRGQQNSSTKYFYALDHLGNIREMRDNSGVLQAQYDFDPFGRVNKALETVASDFSFTGHYLHSRSGLNLAPFRAYNAQLGRWINRDPIEEDGGVNLYAYAGNSPIVFQDLLGLQFGFHQGNWTGMTWANGSWIGEDNPLMPMLPGDVGPDGRPFVEPKNPKDKCAYLHDLCMHIGHSISDSKKRACWNRWCHRELVRCYKKAGGDWKEFIFRILSVVGGPGRYNPDPRLSDPGYPGAPTPGSNSPLR